MPRLDERRGAGVRFEAEWRAFAESDRRVRAPRVLSDRALAAVFERQSRASSASRWRPLWLGFAAAACIAATTIGVYFYTSDGSAAESRSRDAARPARAIAAGAMVPFAADAIHDTESLHLVRLRMPRTAVQALGVALLEPEAPGFVDVEIVVTEDGLPREIRRISAASASANRTSR